ncbi:hypothetical protein [Ammoniphilus resinae]|uniref:Uncharacterized protein n=1 Tax=Ammoniphilus resinae TaxID=861532 RepID=A0ABS4GR10_9BACL|nr:hypothetical protein [Ammoniphilus resinae]MBP1932703.1 hypothetical protein [Ammoniphilus resinae]
MFPAAATSNTPISKLPFYFLLTGVVAFLLLNVILYLGIPSFIDGNVRGPVLWTAAHLTLLGWAMMVAMGAMYQLVSVALQVPIYSEKLGYIQFFVYTIGILGLLHGFFWFQPSVLVTFGILTVIGILLFIFNMCKTISMMPEQTYISQFILSALVYLFITILIGITLAANFKWSFLGEIYQNLFYTHILTGVVGWFTLLIFGFSFKMVPMFSLSHGFGETLPKRMLPITHIGMIATILGLFTGFMILIVVGLIIVALNYILFLLHVKDILQKRMKKKLDVGFTTAIMAVLFGLVPMLLFPLTLGFNLGNRLLISLVYLFIFGWISYSIMGYMYKIVPFLWWTKKYSDLIGRANVPLLKDLMNERLARIIFITTAIGLIGFTIGILASLSSLLYLSQTLLLVAAILFTYMVFEVFRK